jgi:hypothetical protein
MLNAESVAREQVRGLLQEADELMVILMSIMVNARKGLGGMTFGIHQSSFRIQN